MTGLMQMGYDFERERQGAAAIGSPGGFAGPWLLRGDIAAGGLVGTFDARPDWAALRSRFVALHALRRSLTESATALLPAGGFADTAEAVLAACRADKAGVNPVYLGNGKDNSAMTYPVAGSPTPGNRGMQ